MKYKREPRKITTGRPDENLPNNHIKTNKYTCLNFIPKNLFLQFSKLANVYFLVSAICWMEMVFTKKLFLELFKLFFFTVDRNPLIDTLDLDFKCSSCDFPPFSCDRSDYRWKRSLWRLQKIEIWQDRKWLKSLGIRY